MSNLSPEAKAIQDRVAAKRDLYESQGSADKDFIKVVEGKNLRMFLPDSVFVQQRLLSLGEKVITNQFRDLNEEGELTERFYKVIFNHTQIDGKEVNPETLKLPEIQSYALLYWVELLAPLSLWSDTKIKKLLTS